MHARSRRSVGRPPHKVIQRRAQGMHGRLRWWGGASVAIAAWKSRPRGGTRRGNPAVYERQAAAAAGVAAGRSLARAVTHARARAPPATAAAVAVVVVGFRDARAPLPPLPGGLKGGTRGRPTVPLYKEPDRRYGVVYSFASECTCDARSTAGRRKYTCNCFGFSPQYIATNWGLTQFTTFVIIIIKKKITIWFFFFFLLIIKFQIFPIFPTWIIREVLSRTRDILSVWILYHIAFRLYSCRFREEI